MRSSIDAATVAPVADGVEKNAYMAILASQRAVRRPSLFCSNFNFKLK